MPVFHTQHFSITQKRSAFKVGTDSILLGGWCGADGAQQILDIGTGTGILALICAQRSLLATIKGIEIDPEAAAEASGNFSASPWVRRLSAHCTRVQEWATIHPAQYDFIITNPPYFSQKWRCRDERENIARHDDLLPLADLAAAVDSMLTINGIFSFILPVEEARKLEYLLLYRGFGVWRRALVSAREGEAPLRIMMELTRCKHKQAHFSEENIFIRESGTGALSRRYKKYTSGIYL